LVNCCGLLKSLQWENFENKTIGLRNVRKNEKDDGEQKEGENYKRQKWSEMTMVNKILKVKM